jgi:hypothetical protein
MNRNIQKYTSYTLAIVIGILAYLSVASSVAGDDRRVAMCYRGHTIYVEQDDVRDYLRRGATLGACRISS